MRIVIGIIVLLVLIGGLFWFMSGNESGREEIRETATESDISESSSIESDEEVFNEIDTAMAGLE